MRAMTANLPSRGDGRQARGATQSIATDRVATMTETRTQKTVRHIHEGRYAADVSIMFHYDGSGWDPTIDREDVEKLERVRLALRNGDMAAAAKDAKIYELLPVSA